MSRPDEHIFPHATGRTTQTVEQREAPQDLVFYSGWVRAVALSGTYLLDPDDARPP